MRVQSFIARTMPEAIAMVRAAMGPEAVILSSQQSRRGVEVRAAAERQASALLEDASAIYRPSAQPPAAPADIESQLIDRLRHMPVAGFDKDHAAEAFAYHEVKPALAARLIDEAARYDHGDPAAALAQALDAVLNLSPLQAPRPGALLLTGAPGAGKTATAAKLAIRAVLAGHSVALVSADTSAGAVSQLDAYAGLMRVPVRHAGAPEALREAVAATRLEDKDRLTIIDTGGANPFSREDVSALRALISAAAAEPILVTPATGGGDLEDQMMLFAAFGARKAIATKLDATRRLGGLLNALDATGVALGACAQSPYIDDPLEPANAVALARRLLDLPAAQGSRA